MDAAFNERYANNFRSCKEYLSFIFSVETALMRAGNFLFIDYIKYYKLNGRDQVLISA